MSLLHLIQSRLSNLSPAESRLAQVVLNQPQHIVHATTAAFARAADVSDPTVSRFCKTLGYQSFPEFKVALAQSLAGQSQFISESISHADTSAELINKRINANQAALQFLQQELKPEQVDTAVEFLNQAKQIEIFGMGGAAAIAKDAQHKLFRLGTPVRACEDHLMQHMLAAAANKDTVIVFFSFTGTTTAIIDAARIAKENHAKIIAVTHPNSPLALCADVCLPSGKELEDTTLYIPMTTRIVALTIVDILTTGLALTRSPEIEPTLKKIKNSLEKTKSR